jgi:nicotinamidase-related amidase
MLIKAMLKPEETALLVIDVQKKFCEPWIMRGTEKTDAIAKKIARLAPAFRKAGIKIYALRVDGGSSQLESPDAYDFHHFSPNAEDTVITKPGSSGFDKTDLKEILIQSGKKNVLVCGFNLTACVYSTAADGGALGFKVSVILDLSGNDRICYQDGGLLCNFLKPLENQGVEIATTKKIFQALHKARKEKIAAPVIAV